MYHFCLECQGQNRLQRGQLWRKGGESGEGQTFCTLVRRWKEKGEEGGQN